MATKGNRKAFQDDNSQVVQIKIKRGTRQNYSG